jgi:quinol monooxygenase YgiN
MPALPVVAVLVAQPGKEAQVRTALAALVEPTRAEEGCLAYDLYESGSAPGTFVTIESWREAADLQTHLATPHVQQALAASGELLTTAPAVHPLALVEG